MDTTKKPERVKWAVAPIPFSCNLEIVAENDRSQITVLDRATEAHARQIVHEHNTFAALLEALKLVVSDEECYCASHELEGPCDYCIARATIAAAEKEEG